MDYVYSLDAGILSPDLVSPQELTKAQTNTPGKQDQEIQPLDLSLSQMVPEDVQQMLDEYYQKEGN